MIKDYNRFLEIAQQKECLEEEMYYLFNKLSIEEKWKLYKESRNSLPEKIQWRFLHGDLRNEF